MNLPDFLKLNVFDLTCRIVAAFLFLLSVMGIGFPPGSDIGTLPLTLLFLSTFLFLLPKASKIALGTLITFEKEVAQVREDVSTFKNETRELLQVQANMLTAISNTMNQNVTVNLPGVAQVAEAQVNLSAAVTQPSRSQDLSERVNGYVLQSSGDINFALARLRMELEKNLRVILDKRLTTNEPGEMRTFLSTRSLFKKFIQQYPKYSSIEQSYDLMLKTCNAAIHGQSIPEGYAEEALFMGLQILDELTTLADTPEHDNISLSRLLLARTLCSKAATRRPL